MVIAANRNNRGHNGFQNNEFKNLFGGKGIFLKGGLENGALGTASFELQAASKFKRYRAERCFRHREF
ncbi:hypothetical protein QWZ13_17165 [Reinekea marina]|uniref:hypothetical protein n=1 Tax=Reinekea marina TaxID=1310421 RepID=UPI0025B4D06E|nr:hypothetical protein [Reinekea marina]MDN3650638.1 hypothetical protein [Reinekea marina]